MMDRGFAGESLAGARPFPSAAHKYGIADKPGKPLPRLKKRADFVRLTRRGRRWATAGLVLQAGPRETGAVSCGDEGGGHIGNEDRAPRVGFTASRKVGGAVVRNRARRRLRVLADTILGREARADLDFVLIARAATVGRAWVALQADLREALRRVGGRRPERNESERHGSQGPGQEGHL